MEGEGLGEGETKDESDEICERRLGAEETLGADIVEEISGRETDMTISVAEKSEDILVGKNMFMEYDISGDKSGFRINIIKFITFDSKCVTKEETDIFELEVQICVDYVLKWMQNINIQRL